MRSPARRVLCMPPDKAALCGKAASTQESRLHMIIEPTEELISRIKLILIDRDVLNYIFVGVGEGDGVIHQQDRRSQRNAPQILHPEDPEFFQQLSTRHMCPRLASRCSGEKLEKDISWLFFATPEGGSSQSRPTKYVLLYETIDKRRLAPLMDFNYSSHLDFIEFLWKFPSPRQFLDMNSSQRKALKRSSQRWRRRFL